MNISRQRIRILSLFLFAVGTSLFLSASDVKNKIFLTHDESISYLAATGHQGEYEQKVQINPDTMLGKPVSARSWKRLLEIEERYPFQLIKNDLTYHDIHPPLYFWLLHVWLDFYGNTVSSGAALNFVLYILCGFCLFLVGFSFCKSFDVACALLGLWMLNPSVIGPWEARQYMLLAFFVILLIWLFLILLDRSQNIGFNMYVLLTLTSVCGMMTHFYFALPLVGVLVWLTWEFRKDWKNRPLKVFFIYVLSGIAFLLINPGFARSYERHVHQLQEFTISALLERISKIASAFSEAMGYHYGLVKVVFGENFVAVVPFMMVAVVIFIIVVIYRKAKLQYCNNERGLIFLTFWTLALIVFLYMTFRTPFHAMGGQYLALVWPMLFLIFAKFIAKAFGNMRSAFIFLVFVVVVFAPLDIAKRVSSDGVYSNVVRHIKETDFLLIDNVTRGVVLPFVAVAPEDSVLLIDEQKDILMDLPRISQLMENGGVFVTTDAYASTSEGKAKLEEVIATDWGGTLIGRVYFIGSVWIIPALAR